MKKKNIIIIGDVIKSSKRFHPDKWENFHQSVETINKRFAPELIIPFTVYSGDSFGAVCSDISSAAEIILSMQEIQKYYKSRYVLIEDEISYGVEKKSFLTLVGPALWKSEDNLNNIKKSKMFFVSDLQNKLLTITVNTIMNLILSVKNDWNEQEWEVYRNYNEEVKQKELAEKLGITQQYVSKLIKQARLHLIKESEENLKIIINGIHRKVY
ncbi:SatD family protein [Mariniphaga sp.]|uniref:SatD family protein n=1 Tax=Mariniphaga sp. TaxID=1954475 RepID=UPI0035629843